MLTIQTGRACRATKRACRGQKPSTGWVRSSGMRDGAVLRNERPEGRLAEERQQQRGQEGERRQHREGDADRGDRTERAVGREVGEQQAEQARDDRAAGGEDRLERSAPRLGRGIPPPRSGADRLTEPRDVQQRVVGRGTDHEDEEDALHLAVEHDDAGVREPPHGQQRDAQREHGGQQHEDRQQRRSVDDHQDDEDRQQRDDQQQAVDAEEPLDEVGGEAGRPGHPAPRAVPAAVRRPSCGSPRRSTRTSPDASIGTKICTASPSSESDRRRDPVLHARRCRRCRRQGLDRRRARRR